MYFITVLAKVCLSADETSHNFDKKNFILQHLSFFCFASGDPVTHMTFFLFQLDFRMILT